MSSISSEDDLSFQDNISLSNNNAENLPASFVITCPEEKLFESFDLTIELNWKGVVDKSNKYRVRLFCVSCDDETKCPNTTSP